MKYRRPLLASTVFLNIGLTSAFSADVIETDMSVISMPEITSEAVEQPLEIVSGWYLRGDVSGNFSSADRLFSSRRSESEWIGTSYSDTASYGVGAGYQLTDNFRLDSTATYSGRAMHANFAFGCGGLQDDCSPGIKTRANVWELMANAYIDLPTELGFTPYIGAGVGAARVSYKSPNQAQACRDGSSCEAGLSGKDSWRSAWALMAGVAVPISDYAMLDIGYKYREIGRGTAFETAAGSQGDHGIASHEIRAGVRIQTW